MHKSGRDTAQQRRSDKDKLLRYMFNFVIKRLDWIGFLDFFFERNKNIREFPKKPTAPVAERTTQRAHFAVVPAGVKT